MSDIGETFKALREEQRDERDERRGAGDPAGGGGRVIAPDSPQLRPRIPVQAVRLAGRWAAARLPHIPLRRPSGRQLGEEVLP